MTSSKIEACSWGSASETEGRCQLASLMTLETGPTSYLFLFTCCVCVGRWGALACFSICYWCSQLLGPGYALLDSVASRT